MHANQDPSGLPSAVKAALTRFIEWLNRYGESSWDHQSFFAGGLGRRAKALYYRNKWLGLPAVAPMIFCEALLPAARPFFHQRIRFPIADAHYAMGFGFLYQATQDPSHLKRANYFLDVLKETRCRSFKEYCWGYPFDWVTRNGIMTKDTPLITSTPYAYEAFLQVYEITGNEACREILASISRHAATDIKDFVTSEFASSCSYNPYDGGGVINAAAYRAFLLTSAAEVLEHSGYREIAQRNANFVLEAQNADGSWFYARDGVREFVDHFHTCFVMKALAKIHTLTGDPSVLAALERGVRYYLDNFFDSNGIPQPFSKAPRLTVYRNELYDCAECINLCLLLRDRFSEMELVLQRVVREVVFNWVKPDGSFRSRRLLLGWDNVPMHRWAQSQMFRSLALFAYELEEQEKKVQKAHVRNLRTA